MAAPAAFIVFAALRFHYCRFAALRSGLRQEGNICYDAYPPFRFAYARLYGATPPREARVGDPGGLTSRRAYGAWSIG
jgi:hypothetical protein